MPYPHLALAAGLLLQALAPSGQTPPLGGTALFAPTSAHPVLELADGCRVAPQLPADAELRRSALLGGATWQVVGTRTEGTVRRFLLLQGECGTAGSQRRGDGPQIPAGVSIDGPELLADGELRGLAWLQGNDRGHLAVMASDWLAAGRWQAPTEVAAAAAGSQLALSGAVLGDAAHTRLLVWSRFDGHDDEIVWSQRSDAHGQVAWSSPRPVAPDNGVPDISPSLLAIGDGALLAWSRYDGNDYRVVVSRWQDGHFTAPRVLGPRGSVFPTLSVEAAGATLLYRLAAPGGWGAIGLTATGDALRQARVVSSREDRPVVASDDAGIALRWAADEAPTRARWTPPEP